MFKALLPPQSLMAKGGEGEAVQVERRPHSEGIIISFLINPQRGSSVIAATHSAITVQEEQQQM